MDPLVTVIIPTYNAAYFLKEALESVVDQRGAFGLEVLVVDDGSTDGTPEIVESYGSRVRYLRRRHCGRPGGVRNAGLAESCGHYVAFLDADDVLMPGSIDRRLNAIRTADSIGFVYGNYWKIQDNNRMLSYVKQGPPPEGSIFEALLQRNFILTSTVLARRTLVSAVGGFFPRGRAAEDYWLWLQLARRSRCAFVREPVAGYRVRPNGLSGLAVREKLPDLIRVIRAAARALKVPAATVQDRLHALELWLTRENWREGRYPQAVYWLGRALLTDTGRTLAAVRRAGQAREVVRPDGF